MKHYIKPEFKLAYLDSEELLAGSNRSIGLGDSFTEDTECEARERNSFFDDGWSNDK